MREVNLQVWFGEREVTRIPPHFIKCQTPLSEEALNWVNTRLIGRYSVSTYDEVESFFLSTNNYLYLEDPKEATMYELRWAGSEINSRLI